MWLSEWCADDVKCRVVSLVTLGSPHNPPPTDSPVARFDQTRGLLNYIDANYPGAFEKKVKYTSVIGSGITGSISLNRGEGFASKVFSLVAYASYLALSGNPMQRGDGIIPVSTASLSGAKMIELADAKHSNYLPTPLKSIKVPFVWYGGEEVLPRWIQSLSA